MPRANGSALNISIQVNLKDLQVKATAEMHRYKYIGGDDREMIAMLLPEPMVHQFLRCIPPSRNLRG